MGAIAGMVGGQLAAGLGEAIGGKVADKGMDLLGGLMDKAPGMDMLGGLMDKAPGGDIAKMLTGACDGPGAMKPPISF
ncbi:hypothetical protein ACKC9G_16890 [Pokkaliibacter sp. CJK22405]|uniref:hypothetical protein n=1 Tax=Pokkaliibacter sp. CJK22405 TaxID=3384615 RepID=UPI003985476A